MRPLYGPSVTLRLICMSGEVSHKKAQNTRKGTGIGVWCFSRCASVFCAFLWLTFDLEIVKRYFKDVAGVEPDAPASVVFTIRHRGQQFSICIENQLVTLDSDLQLVRLRPRFNRVGL